MQGNCIFENLHKFFSHFFAYISNALLSNGLFFADLEASQTYIQKTQILYNIC